MRFILAIALVGLFAAPSVAAGGVPDFSGSYTFRQRDGSKAPLGAKSIVAVQTPTTIKITRAMSGKQVENTFPLDGSQGTYVTETGARGTCQGKFKGRTLVLDTFVTNSIQGHPPVQIHVAERWNLSSDSKKLTVHTDVDFPGSPLSGVQLIPPSTEIYSRD